MRFVGCQRGVLVLACLLAGCFENSPEQDARTVATAYCQCFFPAMVDTCVDDIVPDISPVSDECVSCVYQNSQMCSTLDDECTDLCDQSATELLGGMR
jgi:hypothetical protein